MYNTHMTKTKIDIDKIARLAQMTPSANLREKLEKQLEATVVHIEGLEKIDTSSVSGTNQVTNLSNVFRDDIVTPSLSQEDALMNSKKIYNGLFMVSAVLPDST